MKIETTFVVEMDFWYKNIMCFFSPLSLCHSQSMIFFLVIRVWWKVFKRCKSLFFGGLRQEAVGKVVAWVTMATILRALQFDLILLHSCGPQKTLRRDGICDCSHWCDANVAYSVYGYYFKEPDCIVGVCLILATVCGRLGYPLGPGEKKQPYCSTVMKWCVGKSGEIIEHILLVM